MPIKKGKTGWTVDVFRDGQRFRRQGIPTYKEAKALQDSVLTGKAEQPHRPLSEVLSEYLLWSENIKRKSPKTVRSDRQRLGVFSAWAGSTGLKSPSEITVDAVRQFQLFSDPPPHVVCGLSNVSNGTTHKRLINRIFLAMAIACGMDAAICDVLDADLVNAARTADLVMNRQIYADSYAKT